MFGKVISVQQEGGWQSLEVKRSLQRSSSPPLNVLKLIFSEYFKHVHMRLCLSVGSHYRARRIVRGSLLAAIGPRGR